MVKTITTAYYFLTWTSQKSNRMLSRDFKYLGFGLSKLASKIYLIIFYFINGLIFSIAYTFKKLSK
jgi:hypothetical protein